LNSRIRKVKEFCTCPQGFESQEDKYECIFRGNLFQKRIKQNKITTNLNLHISKMVPSPTAGYFIVLANNSVYIA
jgi:hypothetical protein